MRGWQLQPGETTLHKVVPLFLKQGGQRTRRNYEDGIAAVTHYIKVAASRRRACSRNFRGLFIKSRGSSFPHVTTGAQRPSARAGFTGSTNGCVMQHEQQQQQQRRSLSATSPPLNDEPWVFTWMRETRRAQEHTCPRKPLTVSTREFRVARLALINKMHDSRDVVRHLKCCTESREDWEAPVHGGAAGLQFCAAGQAGWSYFH